jgi:hypothetical protein
MTHGNGSPLTLSISAMCSEFMQRLDAVEGIVGNASHVFPVTSFLDAVAAFRILLIGCRIELHLLRGELDTARRILEIGVTLVKSIQRPFTHPFYFGIAAHTAVRIHFPRSHSVRLFWGQILIVYVFCTGGLGAQCKSFNSPGRFYRVRQSK